MIMGKIPHSKLEALKHLYYEKKLSMRSIADLFGVSLDAVTYFMRHFALERRTFSEISKIRGTNIIASSPL